MRKINFTLSTTHVGELFAHPSLTYRSSRYNHVHWHTGPQGTTMCTDIQVLKVQPCALTYRS